MSSGLSFPNQNIRIDDTDPSITYTGDNWIADSSGILDAIGNRGSSFRHTLHGTRTGGRISVPFNGTKIEVFGPNGRDYLFPDTSEPIFRCFVDGVGAFNNQVEDAQANNRLICDSLDMDLQAGSHTLTIEVQATPPNVTFWIDWLEYHLPDGAVIDSAAAIYIGAFSSFVERDNTWIKGNDYILTRTNGGTLRFNFTGTSITWFGGSIPEFTLIPRSSAQYSVDGGPPTAFFWEQNPNARTFDQEYFTTPNLSLDIHELVVTYTGSNESIPLMLDYLVVNNGPFPQLPTRVSSATTDPPTTNRTTVTESSSKSGPGRPSATIAGVAGGISFFIIGVAVLLCFLRHRTRKRQNDLANFEPFTLSSQTDAGQHDHYQRDLDIKSRNVEDTIPQLSLPELQDLYNSVPYPARGASLARPRSVHHQDSGVRFVDRDMPPQYTWN